MRKRNFAIFAALALVLALPAWALAGEPGKPATEKAAPYGQAPGKTPDQTLSGATGPSAAPAAKGKSQASQAVDESKGRPVPATGKELWDYLQKQGYAGAWKMWPGKQAFYPGREPHGVLLTTYVNAAALEAISAKRPKLPNGSIIVKENYGQDKKLGALTVMMKKKGYNPEGGDWFWAKYGPDGKIEGEGKMAGCIKCHAQHKGNDFIMTEWLGEKKPPSPHTGKGAGKALPPGHPPVGKDQAPGQAGGAPAGSEPK